MIKNILILIFKKAKECIELKRVGIDRHPCLNSVRRRLTTAYRSASGLAPSLGLRHIPLCHFDCRAISCQVLRARGTSASLNVMCNGLNVVYDGSSDHGAVRRGRWKQEREEGFRSVVRCGVR
jgi:hypothetical protein